MEIVAFDPAKATHSDFAEFYELSLAAIAIDRPDVAPGSYEAMVERMKTVGTGLSPIRYWVAKQEGRTVAAAIVELPEAENTLHAAVEVRVHPDRRRQGIGTTVLRELIPELRAVGRTRLIGQGIQAGGVGEQWALSLGFKRMHGFVSQLLTIADVDRVLWQVPVPAGYRLHQWSGPAPEEVVESYVRARNAIHDAPHGDVTFQMSPEWTLPRLREHEADARRQGIEIWTLVAVLEDTGEVAGLTEIYFYPNFDEDAYQEDTAVAVGHRGRNLGRCMKATLLRRLADERSNVLRVRTRTAGDNVHMQRVNHEIGYATVRQIADVEADVDDMAARLS